MANKPSLTWPHLESNCRVVIASSFSNALPRYDVCVVGTGPAGLAVAMACERNGRSVLLLEAGGLVPRSTSLPKRADRIVDPAAHHPLSSTTRQTLGGTSTVWGGLCVPLDGIDHEERDHVPGSGWPITADEVTPWRKAAARFLGCGAPDFDIEELLNDPTSALRTATLGRIPLQPDLGVAYCDHIRRSARIYCCLGAGVRALTLDAQTGRVIRVELAAGRSLGRLPAAAIYVLAAGGVETTRILLSTQLRHPQLGGGPDGALGRFYMGHLAGQIGTLVFRDGQVARHFLYRRDPAGGFRQRRFSIAAETQRRYRLLNTAFILRLPKAADSRHNSGALSLLHLLLLLSGRQASRSLKLQTVRPVEDAAFDLSHLRNIVLQPASTAADTIRILRMLRFRHMPIVFANAANRYSLRYHAEQAPNRESRIALLPQGRAGRTGDLAIDLRYSPQDIASVVRSHFIAGQALETAGIGHLEYDCPPKMLEDRVAEQATDGYHQIGSTRMGIDPATSVVDRNCQVHGCDNLFVASSSVFPTSGAANPTFPMVCLALRLADHISRPSATPF